MKLPYVLSVLAASLALGSNYSDEWGPLAGTYIPAGGFTSHIGETRTFRGLMGDKGLLIFFNRSADW
jgi:hypothetical protein